MKITPSHYDSSTNHDLFTHCAFSILETYLQKSLEELEGELCKKMEFWNPFSVFKQDLIQAIWRVKRSSMERWGAKEGKNDDNN